MNINTNALLNILSTKVNSGVDTQSIKTKIEKLSVDGNVNIATLVKDKSIRTLINGLFRDLIDGVKTKYKVAELLVSNKQSFSFKNISSDIKTILSYLNNINSSKIPINSSKKGEKNILIKEGKIEKQIIALKNSLLDIKNLDQKDLKENIKNSGVLLESKLLKNSVPISQNIKTLLVQIKEYIEIKDKIATNLNSNTTSNINKDVVSQAIKTDTQSTQNLNIKNDISINLKDTTGQVKNQIINKNIDNIKVTILQIEEKLANIKADDSKSQILNIVKEDIKSIKNSVLNQPIQKEILTNIKTFETKINSAPMQVLFENSKGNIANISSDLKSIILQIKEQIDSKSTVYEQSTISKELKATVEKVLSQIEFYQLLSYTTNSSHSSLSFLQDDIEDADIKFNATNQDDFSCQINLTLKQYGELKVLLVLDKQNNININIGVKDFQLKQMVQSSLQKLRFGIGNIGLSLQSLNVFTIDSVHSNLNKQYGATDILSFGLDIKA